VYADIYKRLDLEILIVAAQKKKKEKSLFLFWPNLLVVLFVFLENLGSLVDFLLFLENHLVILKSYFFNLAES